MSKQKQVATTAIATKASQKSVPASTKGMVAASTKLAVVGMTDITSLQSSAQQLSNPNLPRIQRQVMAGQAALHMGNEHFLRVHKTQQVSTPIFHFSHLQSIQKDDSNGGSYERVYFTTYQGRNIIYEYRDGKRTYHLSYRNHAKRNYYRRGDIILKNELESKQLQKIFTQLVPSNSGDKSVIEHLLELFNTKSYKIGRRIINVETSENGEGSVELQPVLIFSHSDIVPIGELETRNRSQLSGDFIHHATAQELSLLVPILEGIAEFTGDVLTPGRRAAVKGLGGLLRPVKRRVKRQLMKYTALAIARRVLRKTFYKVSYYMGKAIPKAIIEFISTFGKELNGLYQDYQFRSRASQQQRPIPERKIYAAIINAGYSSIATLLKEMFGEKLLAHLDKAADVAEKVDPIFGRTLKQRITNYIKRKFVRFMTVDRVKMLTHAAKEAITKRISEGGTISEHLSSSLVAELKESAQSQLKAIPKELMEQFDLQDKQIVTNCDMSKQKQSAIPATAAKTQQKSASIPMRGVAVIPAATGILEMADPASLQSSVQRLGSSNMSLIQRQSRAGWIGQMHGNRHLQQHVNVSLIQRDKRLTEKQKIDKALKSRDPGDAKYIFNFHECKNDWDRIKLIRILAHQGWVGPLDEAAIERAWASFDNLTDMLRNRGNFGLWEYCIKRGAQLDAKTLRIPDLIGAGGPQADDISTQDIQYEFIAHAMAYHDKLKKEENRLLKKWGYLADWQGVINDESTSFFVGRLLPDPQQKEKSSKLRPIIVFRGSDFQNAAQDWWEADLNVSGVGRNQFEANKSHIRLMLNESEGKVDIVGHSLGAALAQYTAAAFPSKISRMVAFQAPPIDQSTAENFQKRKKEERPEIVYHIVRGDLVDTGGEKHLPGTYFVHDFLGSSPAAHSDHLLFTPDFREKREKLGLRYEKGGKWHDVAHDQEGKEEKIYEEPIKQSRDYPFPIKQSIDSSIRKGLGSSRPAPIASDIREFTRDDDTDIRNKVNAMSIQDRQSIKSFERSYMIERLCRGIASDDDENVILTLLESCPAGDIAKVVNAVDAWKLSDKVDGSEHKRLRHYFRTNYYQKISQAVALQLIHRCIDGKPNEWEGNMVVDILDSRCFLDGQLIIREFGTNARGKTKEKNESGFSFDPKIENQLFDRGLKEILKKLNDYQKDRLTRLYAFWIEAGGMSVNW